MITISTNKFRDNLANYLNNILKDETTLVLSRFGKPMWEIRPYTKKSVDYKKFYGFMGGDETGEEFVNRVRRNKRELNYVKKLRNR